MKDNQYVPLAVVIAAFSLVAVMAEHFLFSEKNYQTLVPPRPTSLDPSTVGGSPPTSTRVVLPSAASARQEAQEPTHVAETASWKICRNKKYGYEIKYPTDWMVWAPGAPEARLTTCDGDLVAIFWGPDIYATLYPVQLNLYIYDDEETARGSMFEGKKGLDDYLSSNAGKIRKVGKETLTFDGERLVWLDGNQLLSFHQGTFYEFYAYGVDDALLTQIMGTFGFIK